MSNKSVQTEQDLYKHNSKEFVKLLDKYLKQLDYATALCDTLGFDEVIKAKMSVAIADLFEVKKTIRCGNHAK